jgi:outer membrane protein assembly factor BamB
MTRPLLLTVFGFASFSLLTSPALADWNFYRGPLENGSSTEKLGALPASGLQELWKASVGIGTSSITVSGERVFTMGNVQDKDDVWCFDAKSGHVLWKHEYPLGVDARSFEGGTAVTPTIDGNRVYTVSHQGDLFCLDAASGKPLWYKHYQQDLGGKRPYYGYAASPLVEGGMLICEVGGKGASTVALDKMTGKVVWKSGDDDLGYASPVAADIAGKRTIVLFKSNVLVGLEAQTGHELWRQPWKTEYDINAATPLVIGNSIFITSGYDTGCGLFEITAAGVNERWRNKNLRAHINTPVFWQGAIYGMDNTANARSALVCLDVKTGNLQWSQKLGGGALVLADGKLVILSEPGELIIGDASSTNFQPTLRQRVLPSRCWVQPTVANGRVFCRNNKGELAALSLAPM